MARINSYNGLIHSIATRAKELADTKMDGLRSIAGFDCDSEYDAQQRNKSRSRGDLIEEILIEEFDLEFDVEFETK